MGDSYVWNLDELLGEEPKGYKRRMKWYAKIEKEEKENDRQTDRTGK